MEFDHNSCSALIGITYSNLGSRYARRTCRLPVTYPPFVIVKGSFREGAVADGHDALLVGVCVNLAQQ